jgi:RimJ/RimL family protein N-acetyltransferase
MKITLRKYRLSDLDRHIELLKSNKVKTSKSKEKKWLEKAINNYKEKNPQFYVFAILLNKKLIGNVIAEKIKSESLHIGYWIGKDYWNKGYATKAVKLFIKEIKKKFKPKKILASSSNPASRRVLEKCKFKKIGRFMELK